MEDKKSSHWGDAVHAVVSSSRQVSRTNDDSQRKYLAELFCVRDIRSMADFGCGLGKWLNTGRSLGATTVCGYDIPEVPLSKRGLAEEEFVASDFTREVAVRQKYDLAMSVEVAEHIPIEFSGKFIDLLTKASDWVMFAAAIPYQGGMGHVNENWIEYWAELFAARGYECYDLFRPKFWNDTGVTYFYRQNTFLFAKSGCDQELRSRGYLSTAKPMTYVHPEMYIKAVNRPLPPGERRIYSDVETYYTHVLPKSLGLKQKLTYGQEKLNYSEMQGKK